jgi:hypothetical protein
MKVLMLAAFIGTVIGVSALAQSSDPDLGTGNIVPPVANVGAETTYAQAPGNYQREYVRNRHTYRFRTPRAIDRDNTSVPGQGVDKDDTTPKSR